MSEFLRELSERRRFGMKPGLDTITEMCRRLGNPQTHFHSIHVAGTNGKGAVCAILDSVLNRTGTRIGRYTSPHLVNLNERFFWEGAPVDDDILEEVCERVHGVAPDGTTFFEALTAAAFCLYDRVGAEVVVLETGLGGRMDATNVCKPKICVITRIGLDHCDWLGTTVEQIATEKAGIIKSGVPVVLGRNCDSVRRVIEARANEVGAPFYYAPEIAGEGDIPADYSLGGKFNRENAITAIAVLKVLGIPIVGFDSIVWPGRFQRVGNCIVDGAHNPPAAHALAEALAETGERYHLIAGFCGDKDVSEVLRILAPYVDDGLAVKTNNPRSLTAEDTARRMCQAGIAARSCESLQAAISGIGDVSRKTLICGSLFLAGEALVSLGAYPWGSARFDSSELLKPKVQ